MAPKHDLAYTKPGSAVEVSIDDDGFSGSWFSATIVSSWAIDRFLVKYHNLVENELSHTPLQEVVCLHQLRPLPPPEKHRDFKSGDKVDAFHNDGWWEGHITGKLGNGRFRVYFRDTEENMVFSKKQLRTHCKRDERDRISELPDCILMHIMSFLDTKDAVQTCILSKRWKDLCKCLTDLTFRSPFRCKCKKYFRKFVSWVLSSRNDSCSLLNVDINNSCIETEELDRVIKYVMFHNVQKLTMYIGLSSRPNLDSLPLVFCSKSLTSLKLCLMHDPSSRIVLPKSLHLPALTSLHLQCVNFTAIDNDCAEPFSNCHLLNTLFLWNCEMHDNAKVLRISNSTLSHLKITSYISFLTTQAFQIALSTPNLSSFTIIGFAPHQLSSSCNLAFLGSVYIGVWFVSSSTFIRCLQVLANVKILKLSWETLQMILYDLSNSNSTMPQPPCFVRLESLHVEKESCQRSDGEINNVVEYLLQNSPKARVDIISA
ncbi:hypothetical protein JHK86_003344 [Glycine max]|nr:hypothetical protein JHK86_003344 [Glycine max]